MPIHDARKRHLLFGLFSSRNDNTSNRTFEFHDHRGRILLVKCDQFATVQIVDEGGNEVETEQPVRTPGEMCKSLNEFLEAALDR